jgi:RNA polymerase sigma-70 factor (ECF subfamily)
MAASKRELEALYRERYLGFRRAFATVTGSYESAHDVVQEAFARALAERRRFRGEAPLGAWVWRIGMRVAHDQRKQTARLPLEELLEGGFVEPARDPELAAALRTLPPRRRLIFFLRYFADLSYREIAAVCEISEGTVAAAIARARDDLASALGDFAALEREEGDERVT